MPVKVFGKCYKTFNAAKAALKKSQGYSDKRAAATVAKLGKEGCSLRRGKQQRK